MLLRSARLAVVDSILKFHRGRLATALKNNLARSLDAVTGSKNNFPIIIMFLFATPAWAREIEDRNDFSLICKAEKENHSGIEVRSVDAHLDFYTTSDVSRIKA